jgi:hypothetical protein
LPAGTVAEAVLVPEEAAPDEGAADEAAPDEPGPDEPALDDPATEEVADDDAAAAPVDGLDVADVSVLPLFDPQAANAPASRTPPEIPRNRRRSSAAAVQRWDLSIMHPPVAQVLGQLFTSSIALSDNS